MRVAAIIFLPLLLAACFSKGDAVERLQRMGRPNPISCVSLNGQSDGAANASYVCEDGEHITWACDSDTCVRWAR